MGKLVTLSFIITTVLSSQVSFAAEGRYQMRKMECVGKVNQKPKSMHPDYTHMGLKVYYFTPKRKDGSVAQSLGWNTFYGQTAAELKADMQQQYGGENWYTGTLNTRKLGKNAYVYKRMQGGYENFTAKYIRSVKQGNMTVDLFQGRFSRKRSVVGTYYYNLTCKAYR